MADEPRPVEQPKAAPKDANAAAIKRLQDQTALSTALLNARTAANSAQAAAIGTVATSGAAGSVLVNANAGVGEATLLSARAVAHAAMAIAAAVPRAHQGDAIALLPGSTKPRFATLGLYAARVAALRRGFEQAGAAAQAAVSEAGDEETVATADMRASAAPLATAGLIVDALAKLGASFSSEYGFGGLSVTADDDLVVVAVAEQLLAAGFTRIWSPARHDGAPAAEALATLVHPLPDEQAAATRVGRQATTLAARLRRDAAAADLTGEQKQRLLETADTLTEAAAAAKAADDAYDAFLSWLGAAEGEAPPPLARILEEKALLDRLADGGLLLFLKVNSAVGGYYTKKNLWTFLGSAPFYVAGGAVVSFTLVDGTTGDIKASGLLTIHGGYAKVHDIPPKVNRTGLEFWRG